MNEMASGSEPWSEKELRSNNEPHSNNAGNNPVSSLDLRTTKCPLNFVKTKLALEKLEVGDVLEIWIALESQSVMNIPKSIAQEGHIVIQTETDEAAGFQTLLIRKQ